VESSYRLIAVKTFDSPAVIGALLRMRPPVGNRVSGAVRGWVAAFPQQPEDLEREAAQLSGILSLPVIYVANHADRFFSALRYDRGELTDAVDSLAPAAGAPRRTGSPEQWRDLLPAGVAPSVLGKSMAAHGRAVEQAAGPAATPAQPFLEDFLQVLGLPQALDGHALAADPNCEMVEVRRYQTVPAYHPGLLQRLLGRSLAKKT
jgi:hypothetical protein